MSFFRFVTFPASIVYVLYHLLSSGASRQIPKVVQSRESNWKGKQWRWRKDVFKKRQGPKAKGKAVTVLRFASCQLPIALVCGDGDGVCKVDASRVFAWHWDLEERFFVAVVEVLWQPR